MDTAVRFSEARGRWVLAAAVLGSGMAMLDGTVVNVALPRLADEFGASVAGLQWTVNAYALTLAGFILLGGALGDRYGRRRVFTIGVVWFAVASAICGFAPDIEILIAARALQGVGGALLMPGSLAILQATFVAEDRARAVGAWSGLGGVAGAVGPFLGGWLVESVSWRWVFLLNLPLAAVVIAIAVRHVPETQDPQAHGRFDILGGTLAAIGLAGITYALTALPDGGSAGVVAGIAGLAAAALFGAVEWHRTQRDSETPAMLPLDIFRSSQFSAINAVTFLVYGAMSVLFFLLVVDLQVVAGFSPITAGTALLPVTVLMLLLSARAGAVAQRIGPRLPITAGLLVAAAGMLLMARIGPGASYLIDVLPAALVFGLGLSAMVAPLTATVLAAVEQRRAGVASGVNNAVARTGGLLGVAAIPPLVGLTGDATSAPGVFDAGFTRAVLVCAAVMLAGAVLALLTVRDRPVRECPEAARPEARTHCALAAPPLETRTAD